MSARCSRGLLLGDTLHPWNWVLRPSWGHWVVPERGAEEAEVPELGTGREACVCSLAAAKTVYLQVYVFHGSGDQQRKNALVKTFP